MKRVLVLFIVGVVLFGAFSAQNANAQSANIAQRIIGTWATENGNPWVFNANGTLTQGSNEFKFAVTDTQLVYTRGLGLVIFNISMSADGQTLILVQVGGNNQQYWLTKR